MPSEPDRLILAEIAGAARRHTVRHALSEDQRAAAVAELREIAGDRPDLLARHAGVAIGIAQVCDPILRPQYELAAGLCREAGADESLIEPWIAVRRITDAREIPYTGSRGTSSR